MRVTLKSHNRQVKRPVTQKHYWYDPELKKMLEFEGTRLVFDYDPTKRRSIPRPITEDIPVRINSWEDIDKFLKDKKYRFSVEEMQRNWHVTINVDDYEWPKIERELRDMSILYEVE